MWLTRRTSLGSSGANPFAGTFLGTATADVAVDVRQVPASILTQIRLRFPSTDIGDDWVSFATGDAGAWGLQTVSTFAEVVGTARPVLDVDYDDATAVGPVVPTRKSLTLHAPKPNPFNPSTRIGFELARNEAFVELTVYDLSGRKLRVLHRGAMGGRSIASGVYLVRLASDRESVVKRAVLVK